MINVLIKETATLGFFFKKSCSEEFRNINRKKPVVLKSRFNKGAYLRATKFIKKRLKTQVFFSKCENFKNSFFEEHL